MNVQTLVFSDSLVDAGMMIDSHVGEEAGNEAFGDGLDDFLRLRLAAAEGGRGIPRRREVRDAHQTTQEFDVGQKYYQDWWSFDIVNNRNEKKLWTLSKFWII